MNLILASRSPRRKALLEQFGLKFSVCAVPCQEVETGEPPVAAAANAENKALAVSVLKPAALVLGADTVVGLDHRILPKPKDYHEACAMLHSLSGREHEVITAVALARKGQALRTFNERTLVRFRTLDEREIHSYAATGEPFDKAGAYAIQGFGALLVESIKGCYYNVVGLPISRLAIESRQAGIEIFSYPPRRWERGLD